MDFKALLGAASSYSSDAIMVAQADPENGSCLRLLYGNPSALTGLGLASIEQVHTDQLGLFLGTVDFANQALLSACYDKNKNEAALSFRVSVTPVPPEDIAGEENCFILVGRPSGNSLSQGREKLYSDIARMFVERAPREAVDASLRASGLYFNVGRCLAARLDLEDNSLEIRHIWEHDNLNGSPPLYPGMHQQVTQWFQDKLIQGEAIIAHSSSTLPKEANGLKAIMDNFQVQSVLIVPVIQTKNVLWLLALQCMSHERVWSKEDHSTFKVIGDLFGNAFHHHETADSLKETRRRFSDIGANIPGVVYQIRENSRGEKTMTYVSQGVRELSGYGTTALMNDPSLFENMIVSADIARYREAMKQAAVRSGEWSLDLRIEHRKTNDLKWVRAKGRAYTGTSNDTVWNGMLLDISDNRRAEEVVRSSEEQLRNILSTSPIAIGISGGKDFQLQFANRRLSDMFGIPKLAVIGFDTREFFAHHGEHRRHWVQTRRNKEVTNSEVQCRSADGRLFWAQISTRLIEYSGQEAILWWAFDITDHKEAKEALAHLAHHDSLTGLANRRLFDEHLQQAVRVAGRTGQGGVLFYFDLDGFKAVNDTHGHGFGDWVLDQVGTRLKSIMRDSDIGARLGGDEFAVIAHGVEDTDAIEAIVDKVQTIISEPYEQDGKIGNIGVSIGVVRFNGQENDTNKIVMLADNAMYEAKKAGKGTYRLATLPANDTQAVINE